MKIQCLLENPPGTQDTPAHWKKLFPSIAIRSRDAIIDLELPDLPDRTVLFLPSRKSSHHELTRSARALGAEVSHYDSDSPDDLRDLAAARIELEQRRAKVLDFRGSLDPGWLWWLVFAGLLYIQINACLRYLEVNWQLPFFDFRGVVYREYLQVHVPTIGGFLLALVAWRLRKPAVVIRDNRLAVLAKLALVFSLAAQLSFSWLFFNYGMIVERKSHVHSEGWGMLTAFEPFSVDRFYIGDTWRYISAYNYSPNVWPFYQPWLILILHAFALWHISRWLIRTSARRRPSLLPEPS